MGHKAYKFSLICYFSFSLVGYPLAASAKFEMLEDDEMSKVSGRDGIEIYGNIGDSEASYSYGRSDNPDAKISVENAKVSGFTIPEADPVKIDLVKEGETTKIAIEAPPITVDASVEHIRIGNDNASLGGSKTEQLTVDAALKLWGNQTPGETGLNASVDAKVTVDKHQMIGDSPDNTFTLEDISTSVVIPELSVDVKDIGGVEKIVIAAPTVSIDELEIGAMYHGDDENRYGSFGISAIETSFELYIDDGGAFSDEGLALALGSFSLTAETIQYRGEDPNLNTFTLENLSMQGWTDDMFIELVDYNNEYQLLFHAPSMTITQLTTGDMYLGDKNDGIFGSLAMSDAEFGVSAYITDGGLLTDTGVKVELASYTANIGKFELQGEANGNDFNKFVVNNLSLSMHSVPGSPAVFEINDFNGMQGLYFSIPGIILDNYSVESSHLGDNGDSYGGLKVSSHKVNDDFVATTMSGFLTDGGFEKTGLTIHDLKLSTALDAQWIGAEDASFNMNNLHVDMQHEKLILDIGPNNGKQHVRLFAPNTTIVSAGVGSMYLNEGHNMGGFVAKNIGVDITTAIGGGTDTLGLNAGMVYETYLTNSLDQNNDEIPFESIGYYAGTTEAESAKIGGIVVDMYAKGEFGITEENGVQKIALRGLLQGNQNSGDFLSVERIYVGDNPAISMGGFSVRDFISTHDLKVYGGAAKTGVGITLEGNLNAFYNFQYVGFDELEDTLNISDVAFVASIVPYDPFTNDVVTPMSVEVVKGKDDLERVLTTTHALMSLDVGLIQMGESNGFNHALTLGFSTNQLKTKSETYLWGHKDIGLNIAGTSKLEWGDINAINDDLNGIYVLAGNGDQPGYDNTVFKHNIFQTTYGYVETNIDIDKPMTFDVENVEVAPGEFVSKLVVTMDKANTKALIHNLTLGQLGEGNNAFGTLYMDQYVSGELKLSGLSVNNADKRGFEVSGTIGLSGSEFQYRGKAPIVELNSMQFEGVFAKITIPDSDPKILNNQGVQVYFDAPDNTETAFIIDIAKAYVEFGAANMHLGYDNEDNIWNDIENYSLGGYRGEFEISNSQLLLSSNSHVGLDIDGHINIKNGKFSSYGGSFPFLSNFEYGYNTTNLEDVSFSLNMDDDKLGNQPITMYINTPTVNNSPTDVTKLIVEIPQISGSFEAALRMGQPGLHDWNGNNILESSEQNFVLGGVYVDQFMLENSGLSLWGRKDGGAHINVESHLSVDRLRLAGLGYLAAEISKDNAINLEGIFSNFVTNTPISVYVDTKSFGIIPQDRTWLYAEFGDSYLSTTVDTVRFGNEKLQGQTLNYRIGGFTSGIDIKQGSYLAIAGTKNSGTDLAGYLLAEGTFTYYGTEYLDNMDNLVFNDRLVVDNYLVEVIVNQDTPISVYHQTALKNDIDDPTAGPSKLVIAVPSLVTNLAVEGVILTPNNPNNVAFDNLEVEKLAIIDSTFKIYGRGFDINDKDSNKFGGVSVDVDLNLTVDEIRMKDANSTTTISGVALNLQTQEGKPVEIGLLTKGPIFPDGPTRLVMQTNDLSGSLDVAGIYFDENKVEAAVGFSVQALAGLDLNTDGKVDAKDDAGFMLTSRFDIWGRQNAGINISGTSQLRVGELQLRFADNDNDSLNMRKIRSTMIIGDYDNPLDISLYTLTDANQNILEPTTVMFDLAEAKIFTKIDEIAIGNVADRSMGGLHINNLTLKDSWVRAYRGSMNPDAMEMYGVLNITDGSVVLIDDFSEQMGFVNGIDDSDHRMTLSGLSLKSSINKKNPLVFDTISADNAFVFSMPELIIQSAGIEAVTVGKNGASMIALQLSDAVITADTVIKNLPGAELAIYGTTGVTIDRLDHYDADYMAASFGLSGIAFSAEITENNPLTLGIVDVGGENFLFLNFPEMELVALPDGDLNDKVVNVVTIDSMQIGNDDIGGFALQNPQAELLDKNDPDFDPDAFNTTVKANVKLKGHAGGGVDVAVQAEMNVYQMQYDVKDSEETKVKMQDVRADLTVLETNPMTADIETVDGIERLVFRAPEIHSNIQIGALRMNNGASFGSFKAADVKMENTTLRVWGHE